MSLHDQLDSGISSKDIDFFQEPFWVQLHNMRFVGMKKAIAEKVSLAMGKVVIVDADDKGFGRGNLLESG